MPCLQLLAYGQDLWDAVDSVNNYCGYTAPGSFLMLMTTNTTKLCLISSLPKVAKYGGILPSPLSYNPCTDKFDYWSKTSSHR